MTIDEIETPALLIDSDTLHRNASRMASYCRAHQLALRPHTKTHKLPEIANLQVRNGAQGITVAKLGEAEVMAEAGLDDIVVVYPLWGTSKWQRLIKLAEKVRLSVTMDSLSIAEEISKLARQANVEVGIRLEFDTGFGRCGLPLAPSSAETALRILDLPSLRWEGVSFYPGHIMGNRKSREKDIEAENERLDQLFGLLNEAEIPCPVVSGGNTPAAFESHRFHGVTEIRPGTYIFNDRNTVDAEAASFEDCATTVLTTVVSTSVPSRAIIDAGSKTFSGDQLLSGERKHYGYILNRPDLILEDLSEEHGHLLVTDGRSPQMGERLRIVPNHVCPCINLQDRVYLVSGEQVIDIWNVAGRGKAS